MRCNYCMLEGAKLVAAQSNRVVTIRPHALLCDDTKFPDGVDVYIHPPEYEPPLSRDAMKGDDDPPTWWAMWLASVPKQCACSTT